MQLIYDDIYGVFVWVSTKDSDLDLSPHFDSREAANLWFAFMKKYFQGLN